VNVYQLALRTPGMYPESAISLKQILQSPNFLRKARDLPHLPHRLCWRTGNFGFRLLFSTMAFLAIYPSLSLRISPQSVSVDTYCCVMIGLSSPRNGIPSSRSSANAWSSLLVVVTSVMSMPWI
jgi:hypothetical protein